ncbi:hypothetical protein HDU91_002501 [Kappamyces sp. JEL0680]|nr:hypothetical protein HDU91_002501 [Kappamyces sp. JEL0680]
MLVSEKQSGANDQQQNMAKQSTENAEVEKKERRLIRMAVALITCFVCGWGPYIFLIAYEVAMQLPVSKKLDQFLHMLPIFNSAVNPLLLYLFGKHVKTHGQIRGHAPALTICLGQDVQNHTGYF